MGRRQWQGASHGPYKLGRPGRIQHAALWVHARRKMVEVHKAIKSPIAEVGQRRIKAIYYVEAGITGKSVPERLAERQARSKPALAALKDWIQAQRRRASSKTALGKALQYTMSRWEALARYADDGRLATDNNLAERLLRDIATSQHPVSATAPAEILDSSGGKPNSGCHLRTLAAIISLKVPYGRSPAFTVTYGPAFESPLELPIADRLRA